MFKDKSIKKMNKKEILTYIVVFITTVIIYLPLLMGHYATDTYNIINKGYEKYAITYSLNDGRPIMCLISLIAQKINMPIMIYVIILTAIALIISSISVIKLKNIILKYTEKTDRKKEYIILAISYIIIFNFAYLENMQFAECAIMSASILLSIMAAQEIIEKNNNYILKSIILAILSVLFYQGTINWLFTITFVLSIFKEKKINIQVIKNLILSGIFGGIGCVVDLIQVKITGQVFNLTQTRMGSLQNIPDNFIYIVQNLCDILQNTYNLFPKNMLFIYLIILLVYVCVFMTKNAKNNIPLNVLAIIFICICTVFAPNLITLSAFGTGRTAYSIGAMIGLVILYMYCNLEENSKLRNENIQNGILYIIMASYIILSLGNSILIMNEHKKVNVQDKQDCEKIGMWIREYEESKNVEVNNIVFIYNSNSGWYYDNIKNHSALCYRALRAEWSRVGAINYYNNRQFNDVINEIKSYEAYINKINYYKNYFSNKSWDNLDKEQLVFEGNTLYYCLY